MINSRALGLSLRGIVVHQAVWPCVLASTLYLSVPSLVQAQSGDGPVAGVIVDELDELYDSNGVIVTTACLEGNPFVPQNPPSSLDATLSGCKLDIPASSGSVSPDNSQLITVLPSNFKDDVLSNVRTYSSGNNTGLESNIPVRALSKDVFLGLANPGLFNNPPEADLSSVVASTADVFCTAFSGKFACARVEPCPSAGPCTSAPSCDGLLIDDDDTDGFCSSLSGLLEGAYNLTTNPLAYAVSTNMSRLAEADSVTLKLCSGFRAQCQSPAASPTVAGNVRVTSMHTQNAAVETPRLRLPYF